MQQQIIDKKLRLYVIDAVKVAREVGLGNRINTIMQTCFFAISGVLPRQEAIEKIKDSIRKTYGKRGEPVVRQNFAAVDAALDHLHEVLVPEGRAELSAGQISLSASANGNSEMPAFVRDVTLQIYGGRGDQLPRRRSNR